MPHGWEGGREGLYTHPGQIDPEGIFNRIEMDELLHPLIEAVAYGDDLKAKGRALYQVVLTYDDGCPRGDVREAFALAFTPAALNGSRNAAVDESLGPKDSVLLHFCEGRREDCHVMCSHRSLLHVDRYRTMYSSAERGITCEDDLLASLPWTEAWQTQITEKLAWISRLRFHEQRHDVEWDDDGAGKSFSASSQKMEDQAAARKERKEQQFRAHLASLKILCRCGRPPANQEGEVSWCLLCTKPTGNDADNLEGMVPFGSEEVTLDKSLQENLVWSMETGSWRLVEQGPFETEYTRAFRRKPHFSLEYVNAYLYLQRTGRKAWLEKFDSLEEWLDNHPGDFVSLPRYPSAHAKDPLEKRLGQFIMWESIPCMRYLDLDAPHRALELAEYRLLSSLDGWTVEVGSRRVAIFGRCANRWAVMFEEIDAWFQEHSEPPRQTSNYNQEKRFAWWWNEQWKMQKKWRLQ